MSMYMGMGPGMGGMGMGMGTGMGMGMGPDAAPPAKRRRTVMGGAMGMEMGDATKETLVASIKACQRQNEDQKQAWWNFCDSELGGKRDPSRHDVATLRHFVETYGIEVTAPQRPSFPTMGMGMGMSPMMGIGPGGADAAKMSLVNRVKSFQKQGEAEKEAWYEFCGVNRDPARHDASRLQEFLNLHGA
mmetsp:Transcript_57196/g.159190  ORF Transcript_57196/g.159190 Transcript_57196/m.159190 type:complete len:189 (-) Transcript_57196:180-746(-)